MEYYQNYLGSCGDVHSNCAKTNTDNSQTRIVREELVLISKTELAKLKLDSFILNEISNEPDVLITKCLHQGCISFNICIGGIYGQTYGTQLLSCDFCESSGHYCSVHAGPNLTKLKQNNGRCWLACKKCFAEKIKDEHVFSCVQ